jgi:hypothetical protein
MLREPHPIEKKVEVRKDNKGRFQVKPLEDRIAPAGGSKYHTDNGNHYGQYK